MKVYIPTIVEDISKLRNPFLKTLVEGIQTVDSSVEFVFGFDFFWAERIDYDILHLMWPEDLLFPNHSSDEVKNRLDEIRASGIKIVSTCHNLHSHKVTQANKDIYDVMYAQSDLIIHLGKYSFNLFKEKYSTKYHIIIPHHVYDTLYRPISNKELCCKSIKLSSDRNYILCMGAFRNEEEKEFILNLERKLKDSNIYILAPTFLERGKRRCLVDYLRFLQQIHGLKKAHPHLIIKGTHITNEEIPFYYGASELCLIQRLEILNSGNLPFSLLMGKVVVGPNKGNIGEILRETGNYAFDVNNTDSVIPAIMKGLQASQRGKGETNREYALNKLSTIYISKLHYDTYQEINNN